jgi:hypothetical protein
MKRRTLKKQIAGSAQQLVTPIRKYLVANARVHQDILYRYERKIEIGIFHLMRMHLELDPSWPHRKRWLDRLSEEFSWERKSGILYGKGELFWGHLPEVGRKITGLSFTAELKLCARHGVEYVFRYGKGDNVRSYYSRRRCWATRI